MKSLGRLNQEFLLVAMASIAILATPALRSILETGLPSHMLVQLPLLVAAGWIAGKSFRAPAIWRSFDRGGVTGLLIVVAIAMFWMLPRSIDSALRFQTYELAKFISLPCAGVALAWSYSHLHYVLKGVVHAHAISILWAMGWLYVAAPVRLCNSYLSSDQTTTGYLLFGFGIALSLYWGIVLLFGLKLSIDASPKSTSIWCSNTKGLDA